MKKFFLILVVFSFSMLAVAQLKKESKLIATVERLHKAMIDAEPTVLSDLVSDKLSYVHSSGAVDTKTDFVEKIKSGKSDFVTINISEQVVAVSKKTAVVRHRLDATTNDGGKPGNVQLRIMQVWQKMNGGWKLLARQATKIG